MRCGLRVLTGQRKLHEARPYAERLQVLRPITFWDRVWNIGNALRRLPYRNRIDYLVFKRVYHCRAIGIFESNVDPRTVAGRP